MFCLTVSTGRSESVSESDFFLDSDPAKTYGIHNTGYRYTGILSSGTALL
jgi:hypothetical protein